MDLLVAHKTTWKVVMSIYHVTLLTRNSTKNKQKSAKYEEIFSHN